MQSRASLSQVVIDSLCVHDHLDNIRDEAVDTD